MKKKEVRVPRGITRRKELAKTLKEFVLEDKTDSEKAELKKKVWLVNRGLATVVSANPMDREPTPDEKDELDVKYLGYRLPGNPQTRQALLESTDQLVKKYGAEWVWNNRERLLLEAQFIVDEGGLGTRGKEE
jgi:hypothetical protein